MRIKLYGTRITTGCGHSWRRRHLTWTRLDLSGATTDCRVCGELLIIPAEQFIGQDLHTVPVTLHAPRFHRYLHQQGHRWPADGAGTGTGYIEFAPEES